MPIYINFSNFLKFLLKIYGLLSPKPKSWRRPSLYIILYNYSACTVEQLIWLLVNLIINISAIIVYVLDISVFREATSISCILEYLSFKINKILLYVILCITLNTHDTRKVHVSTHKYYVVVLVQCCIL